MKATKPQHGEERIQSAIRKIIDLFVSGNVPQAIAIATFPPFDVPSNAWSLLNRLIMAFSGTSDSRGWRQWKQVGRYVRKGEKAFYILAPRMMKKSVDDPEEESGVREVHICSGFVPVPVFAIEQTEGEPLDYQELELPELPLIGKAREWGIDVKPIAFQGGYRGYYQHSDAGEKIRMATAHEKTFFHELSHATHKRIKGNLQGGQDARQEIVAELAAQTLAQLVGTEMESTLGNSYEYIKGYAEKLHKDVGRACLSVIADVEKILTLVLK